mgnify:CR=1 FL=1
MSKQDEIRAFLEAMRRRHSAQVDNVELPEGTSEYIESLMDSGDTETLLAALTLSYLTGLQTGFAISNEFDDDGPAGVPGPPGPLEA